MSPDVTFPNFNPPVSFPPRINSKVSSSSSLPFVSTDAKEEKFKLGVRSFLLKFDRKPGVQKLAMEVGNRKGGKAGSGLVWPILSQLLVALFIPSLLLIL